MKKINITILEEERAYAKQLAFALQRKEPEGIEAAWYTDLEHYQAGGGRRPADLILVGESFLDEQLLRDIQRECGGILVLLSEDGVAKNWQGYPVIRKYSGVEEMVRKIYALVAEYTGEDVAFRENGKRIVGVYAPWQQELSVLFSVVLLQILSESERFLYVSLLEGFGRRADEGFGQEENLADLISFLRMERGSAQARLKSICRGLGRGSCLPPVDNPQNIFDMSEEDYRRLWDVLGEQTEYGGLLMEFGIAYPLVYEDMKRCQVIYCPYQEEVFLENRREQLAHILKLHGAQEVWDKICEVRLPRMAFYSAGGRRSEAALAEELLCGEFGDAVRGLVDGYGR